MSGVHPMRRPQRIRRALVGGALVLFAALPAGCGSAARGLIPAGQAGPLVGDFEAVQHAAENGGGNCSATNAAISKTEHDFEALSSRVDSGLRTSLRQGIENLGARARELCTQPSTSTTTTSTTQSTTPPKTTPPKTTSTPTTTTPPTETTEAEREASTGTGGAPSEEQKHEGTGGGESETPGGHTGGTEGTRTQEGSG